MAKTLRFFDRFFAPAKAAQAIEYRAIEPVAEGPKSGQQFMTDLDAPVQF
jgi:hypothetical protein